MWQLSGKKMGIFWLPDKKMGNILENNARGKSTLGYTDRLSVSRIFGVEFQAVQCPFSAALPFFAYWPMRTIASEVSVKVEKAL